MVQSLLERATLSSPVIQGDTVTFVWRGLQPPQLIGDFTGWEWGAPLTLTEAEHGLWTRTLTFPPDAYMEYAFWQGGQRVADPLNPHTVPDGLGHHNHYFYMPRAAPTPFLRHRRGVPRGTVTRHVVEDRFLVVGGKRTVELYQPPTSEPCPLLVVLDGQDYGPRGKIVPLVDTLIAQQRIRPLALALVYHGRQARGVEYACSEATLSFLTGPVLDLAQERLKLTDIRARPGSFGILGASMGGLMALFAGLRAPSLFGRVLSQSGAFSFGRTDPVIWDLVRHCPVLPLRIWMDVGGYEGLLAPNQRLHELLLARGYDVAYHEYAGGHNYTCWRNDLPTGLQYLFGAVQAL